MTEPVAANLAIVRSRIAAAAARAGRRAEDVTLVAVTKTVDVERIRAALAAGVTDLGENRAQEARGKVAALGTAARWHFIGHLQVNKVKYVLGSFQYLHSLDRLSLAEAVEARGVRTGHTIQALVEINVSGEATKAGLSPAEVIPFLRQVARYEHLRVVGLMTIAPYVQDPELVRPVFQELRSLAGRVRGEGIPGVTMEHLSMGMSGDYEVAIEEGATMVRIGTALFGARM